MSDRPITVKEVRTCILVLNRLREHPASEELLLLDYLPRTSELKTGYLIMTTALHGAPGPRTCIQVKDLLARASTSQSASNDAEARPPLIEVGELPVGASFYDPRFTYRHAYDGTGWPDYCVVKQRPGDGPHGLTDSRPLTKDPSVGLHSPHANTMVQPIASTLGPTVDDTRDWWWISSDGMLDTFDVGDTRPGHCEWWPLCIVADSDAGSTDPQPRDDFCMVVARMLGQSRLGSTERDDFIGPEDEAWAALNEWERNIAESLLDRLVRLGRMEQAAHTLQSLGMA